ncbi:helix-turn-helix domain-containing protein [Pseudomonas sp. TNT11]|uniref:Helix-turn-helix domain-containing protein n=1 Tax=Pseudomonas emilianonis TaxID=2915812 RepID=A0ABT0EBJ5_9PSED|nr:helix-turn-helix domain-containing protein [Pseudomonas emilianonis]MCK1783078.1 helix-turn-helix domain-containing protein [Pseudomonas emilianonis]
MTSIAPKKVIHTTVSATDIRSTLIKHSTSTIDNLVFDKNTGELLGCYTFSDYDPEPIHYPAAANQAQANYITDEDGSPIPLFISVANNNSIATVSALPAPNAQPLTGVKSGKGRKEQVIKNPMHAVFSIAMVEETPIPWLDDYVRGAINTGPGVINGKYSVSPADVTRLLRLPEISVDSASKWLLNHDRNPMSVRQIQRVVEAARVALKGIALYLERHPKILPNLGAEIDFSSFWTSYAPEKKQQGRKEHPKRQEVLRLLEQGEDIKAIARNTGVSRHTIRKWQRELLAA